MHIDYHEVVQGLVDAAQGRRAAAVTAGRSDASGGGAPPLMLLPGTLCDRRVFAPMLAHMPGVEALTPSLLPGTSTAEVAARLLAEAPPRFALLGFSLGGIVAMEMAAAAPERIAGLALIAANFRAAPPATHAPRREAALAAQASGLHGHVRDTLWPLYVGRTAQDRHDLREAVLEMAGAFRADAYAAQTEIALSRADRREALRTLAAPMLVLGGEEDVLCPPAVLRQLADALPFSRLAVLPGCGHFAVLEAPGEVASQVSVWLAEVRSCQTSKPEPSRSLP